MGTAARMGPGFLPRLLSWALIGLGGLIVLAGMLDRDGERMQPWQIRPLLAVLGGVLLFMASIKFAGLIVAAFVMSVVAAFGTAETRWVETLIAAALLACASSIVFVKGLGIPMSILPAGF